MALLKNPYACAFCHESFINAKTLVSHVQIIHEPAKPNDKDQNNTRIKTSTNKAKANTFERTKRIEPMVTENRDLQAKFEVAKEKLKEKEADNAILERKISDFKIKEVDEGNEAQKLRDTIEELQKQINELEAINIHRQSGVNMYGSDHRQSAAFDISMDNPHNILSPPRGETLGDAVVMNLQEEIATLKAEIEQSNSALLTEQEKRAQLTKSLDETVHDLRSTKVQNCKSK